MDTDFYLETPIIYILKQIIICIKEELAENTNPAGMRTNNFSTFFKKFLNYLQKQFCKKTVSIHCAIKGVNLCEFLYSTQANLEKKCPESDQLE